MQRRSQSQELLLTSTTQNISSSVFTVTKKRKIQKATAVNTSEETVIYVVNEQTTEINIEHALSSLLTTAEQLTFIRSPVWTMSAALRHLAQADARFIPIFQRFSLPTTYALPGDNSTTGNVFMVNRCNEPPFRTLLQIIVYQQLSGSSAQSVWNKFIACLGLMDITALRPSHVLRASFEEVVNAEDNKKQILVNGKVSGLSSSKAKYVQHLAAAFDDTEMLKDVNFASMGDEEICRRLTAVKGLGLWSAQMFLIFALHRPNVLPIGDLGVRKGLSVFLGRDMNHFEGKEKVKDMEAVCAVWRPYASVACFYMWKLYEEHLAATKKPKVKAKA